MYKKIIATEYLTSTKALQKLCRDIPGNPISYGVKKTMVGIGIGAVVYFIQDYDFGTKIIPFEAGMNLADHIGNTLLINRIEVESTRIKHKTKALYVNNIASFYKEYTTKLQGKFHHTPINLYTVTSDENFAKSLAGFKKNDVIYVRGTVDKDGDIDVEGFGEAIRE